MKILAVTSGKGGVGKSTLSLNIARQLSLGGKRVLLVDFDIHNKGTTNLFLPKIEETSRSVTEIIGASEGFSKELSSESIEHLHLIPLTADGGLFFLPAARPQEMMEWQNFLASTEDIVKFFKSALAAIAEKNCLDVVLIDCYGGIDSLTVAAAGIADDTIIVNEPDVITFGGTLTLYKYMIKKYERLAVKPRFHFVINRISTRHSFSFLNKEYQKNLVKLSIDKNILGYFPYDKLLLDTFGDYPFFSELLPNGLFTQKVRLLIATLWGTQGYENFVEMSEARRKKIFERTSETGFAEPEAILRAMVNLPFYLVVPLLLLLGLHFQIGRSLSYWTIAAVLYTAGAALLLLILTIGAFEPVQISRWLWREATYKRHKRNLKKEQPAPYRMTKAVIQLFVASIPALVGVAIIVSVSYGCFKVRQDIWNKDGRLEEISIWPGEITGLRRGGHYMGLHLNRKATIKPGTDLTGADFSYADMGGVQFRSLTMRGVNFTNADLLGTAFDKTDLSGALFNGAQLGHNTFSSLSLSQASFNSSNLFNVYMANVDLSGARFTNSYLRLHFQGSNIFARGASQADFSDANLISVEGDPKLDILKKSGAKVVKTPEDEYKMAVQAKPPRLDDMIEALVLQGSKASLVEAEAKLRELDGSLQKTPSSVTATKVGMFYLLRLLHAEMANQPTQQPAQQWCAWIGEHQILGGWSWEIWDADMQNKPLPPALKKELSRIEDSAQNKKRPDPFCNVATGATGTSATAASK